MNIDPAAEGEDKTAELMFWKGEPIDENMEKRQLIEIISWLGKDIQSMREGHKRDMEFMRMVSDRRV